MLRFKKALEVWRMFLLDQRDNVSDYDQHVVVLGGKGSPQEYGKLAKNFVFRAHVKNNIGNVQLSSRAALL